MTQHAGWPTLDHPRAARAGLACGDVGRAAGALLPAAHLDMAMAFAATRALLAKQTTGLTGIAVNANARAELIGAPAGLLPSGCSMRAPRAARPP
eukprot:COSAG04_NODE_84_length_27625_cov_23.289835_15_plen_95_part_00